MDPNSFLSRQLSEILHSADQRKIMADQWLTVVSFWLGQVFRGTLAGTVDMAIYSGPPPELINSLSPERKALFVAAVEMAIRVAGNYILREIEDDDSKGGGANTPAA